MGEFLLYVNPNAQTRSEYPYLLDLQSALLDDLSTRVVAPLGRVARPISILCPEVEIEGERWVVLTQQLAGIAKKQLAEPVSDLSHYRTEIVAALDLLFTGI